MKKGRLIAIKILATLGSLSLISSMGVTLQTFTKMLLIKMIIAIIFIGVLFGLLDLVWGWNILFKKKR